MGRYTPGTRLIEADLTHDFTTSRGPVREALKRLAAEGVITLGRHRGAAIRTLSRREALELLDVVEALLLLAIRLCGERIATSAHRERFAAASERLLVRRSTRDGSRSADRAAFYDAIVDLAGNLELARMNPVLQTQLIRMQLHGYLTDAERRRQFADYDRLSRALLGGDVRGALRIFQSHMRRSRRQVENLPDDVFAADETA